MCSIAGDLNARASAQQTETHSHCLPLFLQKLNALYQEVSHLPQIVPVGTCAIAIFVSLVGRKIIPANSQAHRHVLARFTFLTHFSLGET